MKVKLFLYRCVALSLLFTTEWCFVSCNNENAPECFKSTGATITYSIPVTDFNTIYVNQGINLVIAQGDTQTVTVQTGKNLKEYITATVADGTLKLSNNESCNWTRQYNTTTITVTTPNLNKILSATQFNISSAGTLHFPDLTIQSGLFLGDTASAVINLDLQGTNLTIEDNQNLDCFITGSLSYLNLNFYAGDARFNGTGLEVQKVKLFHRSSNDVRLNVSEEITGTVYSTGNLILLNHPPTVNVDTKYTGKVIYE